MRAALQLAGEAEQLSEIPIGAVVVHEGHIVGEGFNRTIVDVDPSAHAEVVAIRQAASHLGNYRLVGCTLYVTVEPCSMCTGLLVHSRISRLVYGAKEPKAGAIESAVNIQQQAHFNHRFDVTCGVLEADCSEKIQQFFKLRRERKKQLRRSSTS